MKITNKDFSQQTAKHIALAKDLCLSLSERWGELFAIIDEDSKNGNGGWLSSMYAHQLRDDCNSSVEDFYLFLYEYLTRDNNYFLNGIIEKGTHFFSGYFKDILQGAYKEFKAQHDDRMAKAHLDDDPSGINHETLSVEEHYSPAVHNGFHALRKLLWKKSQKDCLILLLRHVFCVGNEYSAKFLGMGTANAVSQRLKRFQEKKFFSADGMDSAQELVNWLQHKLILTFTPDNNAVQWEVKVHLPYNCDNPDKVYCLMECKSNNTPIVSGILHLGETTAEICDGVAEICLKDIQTAVYKNNGLFAVQIGTSQPIEGYPLIVAPEDEPLKIIDDDLFIRWKDLCYSDSRTGKFIADFGVGLAYLLNENSDFQKYGSPAEIKHSQLLPTSGEAWVIFASSETFSNNGFLPVNGFIMPLEWRFHPECNNPHSTLLPPSFIELAKKISNQLNAWGWGLYPARRFFHDSIDFSKLTLCGGHADSISSAWLSLSSALVLAMNNFYKPLVPVFASAQYNFERESLTSIGLLEQKLNIAEHWGAKEFFVCKEQFFHHSANNSLDKHNVRLIPVIADTPVDYAQNVAYHFLKDFKPQEISKMKNVHDEKYKVKRAELVKNLSAMANAIWDKDSEKKKSSKIDLRSFVILIGNPGMGKSLLMHDLVKRWHNHNVISYVCKAGQNNSCFDFIRNLSYQLAIQSSDFAKAIVSVPVKSEDWNAELTEKQSKALYAQLVYLPLTLTAKKNKSIRNYIVVDGLDEDDSGLIASLLCDPDFRLPQNYSVVVSTRPVEPLYSSLKNVASAEMNLANTAYAEYCNRDLGKFIINLIYGNETIRQCWGNAVISLNDDKLREKIARKDRSFLYASYVLQGIEDGFYHFDKLDQELPAGLVDFYNKSFKYRFANSAEYDKVRPLLAILLKEPNISLQAAQNRLNTNGVQYPIGKMIQALRGYCIAENNELSLADASLRDWLCDPIHNPDFSIF